MLNYYQAKTDSDCKFIASLFCPKNTQYMMTKKKSPKSVKQSISQDRIHYILQSGKEKIGWFNLRKQIDSSNGIFGMIIDYKFQGKGYGEEAMKLLEKEAKKLKIKKLKLEVFDQNKKAINLYRKMGYKEFGKLIAMEKKI